MHISTNSHSYIPRTLAGAILIAATISFAGCTTMQPNVEGEEPFAPDWGGSWQLPPTNGEVSGLSDTSRQIERNLGFQ